MDECVGPKKHAGVFGLGYFGAMELFGGSILSRKSEKI